MVSRKKIIAKKFSRKTKAPLGKKQIKNKKNRRELTAKIVITLIALVAFISSWAIMAGMDIITFYNKDNEKIAAFGIEIVQTEKEREKGLMFREKLDKKRGMLFIFDDEMIISMWMKNTYIPLDMIFIGEDDVVNCVRENTTPESLIPIVCLKPSKYVLEINAGMAEKYGISAGDTVKIRR